jgi:hypothetical protein
MATSKEYAFNAAVSAAEGVRQTARAAAFTAQAVAGSIPPANLAAYVTALEAADNAYITAVNSSASTNTPVGTVVGGQTGPSGQAFVACCWIGTAVEPLPVGGSMTPTLGNVANP